MKKCDSCGSRIFLGGVRANGLLFCHGKCHDDAALRALAQQVPVENLQKQVDEVHSGKCPMCGGPGPVDVHSSYRIWSVVHLSRWVTRQTICCRKCGVKRQLGDLAFSFFLGWWSIHGLVMTPLQILKTWAG